MSKSDVQLAYPLGMFRAEACSRASGPQKNSAIFFFPFFPCNPLKVHETTKEKLGDSKEIFGGSKKILGKKKKKFGGAGDFERAPAALFVSRAAREANPPWRNPRGRRPRLR